MGRQGSRSVPLQQRLAADHAVGRVASQRHAHGALLPLPLAPISTTREPAATSGAEAQHGALGHLDAQIAHLQRGSGGHRGRRFY